MVKSWAGYYGFLIPLVVLLNAGKVWAQSNDASPFDSPLPSEMITSIKETSNWCGTFTKPDYRYGKSEADGGETQNDVTEQRPSPNRMMVTEDMRCRQCHGKCTADSLRCRSQCLSDSACLVHCEERSSKCNEMCKQIFQCGDKETGTF